MIDELLGQYVRWPHEVEIHGDFLSSLLPTLSAESVMRALNLNNVEMDSFRMAPPRCLEFCLL